MGNRKQVGIGTYSGKIINPFYPMEEDICIEDIAHALSMQCRFNGHISEFYSVAEHSLKVCELLEKQGCSPLLQMYGLLHDASEAYLADVPKPFKDYLDEYLKVEEVLQTAIEHTLIPGDVIISNTERAALNVVDREMCLYESKEFQGPLPWRANIFEVHFKKPMTPKEVRVAFLKKYYELGEVLYLEQR